MQDLPVLLCKRLQRYALVLKPPNVFATFYLQTYIFLLLNPKIYIKQNFLAILMLHYRRVWHSCHAHYRFIKVWRASPYKAQSSLPHAQETVCPLRRMLPIRCCRCLFHQPQPHCASTERQSQIERATSRLYDRETSRHPLQQVCAAPSMPCHILRVRT